MSSLVHIHSSLDFWNNGNALLIQAYFFKLKQPLNPGQGHGDSNFRNTWNELGHGLNKRLA